ncbi:MAG: A24 family peptidase [Bryobacteraceae bacterium]
MTLPAAPVQIALVILVLTAALWDLVRRRIPNWLTVSGAIAGLAVNTWLSGWSGLGFAAGGMGVALAVYIPLFLLRAMGGGDVKLMAAVGTLMGPLNWLIAFLLISILGGVIALGMVIAAGRLARTLHNVFAILRELAQLRAPYQNNPEFDTNSGAGTTLAHGAVIALGIFAFLALAKS